MSFHKLLWLVMVSLVCTGCGTGGDLTSDASAPAPVSAKETVRSAVGGLTVTANPSTVVPGGSTTISVSGAYPYGYVRITRVDPNGGKNYPTYMLVPGSTYTWTTTASTLRGAWTFRATDDMAVVGQVSITVGTTPGPSPSPSPAATPQGLSLAGQITSAQAGGYLAFRAGNGQPGTTLTLYGISPAGSTVSFSSYAFPSYYTPSQCVVDFGVVAQAPAGTWRFYVRDSVYRQSGQVNATVTAAVAFNLSASKTRVAPGGSVVFTLTGGPANSYVYLNRYYNGSTYNSVVYTDANGRGTFTWYAPTALGYHEFYANSNSGSTNRAYVEVAW